MTRARRAPSTRYPTLVLDGARMWAAGGRSVECATPDAIGPVARQLVAEDSIVWIHEDAHQLWTPGDIEQLTGARKTGGGGWLVLDGSPSVYIAMPAVSGTFDRAPTPRDLGVAVELWRATVGMAYLHSGASTVHKLISSVAKLPGPDAPPALDPVYRATAWSVPANVWGPPGVLDVLAGAGRRWVRAFDRSGSYLAAWRGVALAAGEWVHVGRSRALPGGETGKPAGYWLVDREQLPEPDGLFDPWRRHTDPDGPLWLTTPLVQLAADIAGGPIEAADAWWATERCRALDPVAERLAGARTLLMTNDTPGARVALAALKDGYAAATSWFEHGPKPPDPLGRPSWRHTILDRCAANTYRALAGATPGPFAMGEVDAALFALDGPDDMPEGLREGLGGWKPKGPALPIGQALDAYTSGGPRAVIALAEGTAA